MNILWPGYPRPLFLGDIFIKRKTELEGGFAQKGVKNG